MGGEKVGIVFASSGNFSALNIKFQTFQSTGSLYIFSSEGHGNNPGMHINLQGICFIDNEKWQLGEKKISLKLRFWIGRIG